MKFSPLTILFLGGIVLTAGDLFAAQFMRYGGSFNYITVLLFYFIGLMLLIQTYRYEDIAVASTILVIFNISILTIVGIAFLGESISSSKIIGLILGLVAVTLLQIGKRKVSH